MKRESRPSSTRTPVAPTGVHWLVIIRSGLHFNGLTVKNREPTPLLSQQQEREEESPCIDQEITRVRLNPNSISVIVTGTPLYSNCPFCSHFAPRDSRHPYTVTTVLRYLEFTCAKF